MEDKSTTLTTFDEGMLNEQLSRLISEWELLQARIEEISRQELEQHSMQNDVERDFTEERLQSQQSEVMRQIAGTECSAIADKLEKLEFWQRCKSLQNKSIHQFSLTDQIGLSINV